MAVKKRYIFLIITLALALIFSILVVLRLYLGLGMDRRKLIDGIMDANYPKMGWIIRFSDSHSGFLGDGETYVVIQYSKDQIQEVLNPLTSHVKWRKPPLPLEVQSLLGSCDPSDRGYKLPISRSKIRYYFIDSQAKWYPDRQDLKDPPGSRYSFNFTLAILDLERNRLYLYREDT